MNNLDDCRERDADAGDVLQFMNINEESVVESEAVHCIDVIDNASFIIIVIIYIFIRRQYAQGLKVATLNYVNVLIYGKRYKALEDSGC